MKIQAGKLNVDLAQLVEHWHDEPEVMVQSQLGVIFEEFFV